jgi:hypothetical protein
LGFFKLFPCDSGDIAEYKWYRKLHGGKWYQYKTDFCGLIWLSPHLIANLPLGCKLKNQERWQ